MLKQVLSLGDAFSIETFTKNQVLAAIKADRRDMHDFAALLSVAADDFLEEMAVAAKYETARHFGNGIQLFTPLYLANYCTNHCTYCAFAHDNTIKRGKLTFDEIEQELLAIAATGLDEILLLTGESRTMSNFDYICKSVKIASKHFSTVGLEVYPMETEEYAKLRAAGADFVNVYQETYMTDVYANAHPKGKKRDFNYRFNTQERAMQGGMRGVSFGVLFGLGDFRRDAFSAGIHGFLLQQKYPHAEVSFSVPRIRAFEGVSATRLNHITDRQLLQIMLAYRLFLPFAGITISTRESEKFRDNVVGLCATKMSAGVVTGVGGHDLEQKGDKQFEIADMRSVDDIHKMLLGRGLQPVYTNYIAV